MNITEMQNLAQVHGRKDLYILTMGTIASISNSSSTPTEIVDQIKETLLALDVVRPDESLPWHAKRLPAKESLEEIVTTDDITSMELPEGYLQESWTYEEIMRNEA